MYQKIQTTKTSSLGIECQIIKENIDILSFCEQNYNATFIVGTKGWYNTNCLLPEHMDVSPSFGVNSETNMFSCFGCGRRGSVIDLVMMIENMDLSQAVRFLLDYLDIQPDISSQKFYQIRKLLKQTKSKLNRENLLDAKIKIYKKQPIISTEDYYKKICKLFHSYTYDNEHTFIGQIYDN